MDAALTQFIEAKIKAYTPPSREGTPKGEAIGFSPEKYAASLWALSNLDQKVIAEKIGCNYRSLLTCRSQPDFKTIVAHHAGEYSEVLLNALQGTISHIVQGDARNFIVMTAGLLAQDNKFIESMGDASDYSEILTTSIIETLSRKIDRITETASNDPKNLGARQFAIIALRLIDWLEPTYTTNSSLAERASTISNKIVNLISPVISGYIGWLCSTLPDEANAIRAAFAIASFVQEQA